MKKLTIVWTLVLIMIVGGLTYFGLQIKKNNPDNIKEKAFLEEAKKYLGLYPGLYPSNGGKTIIKYEDMKADGYNKSLESECTGYVVVKSVSIGFEYEAYVKCPDYTTDGYQE